MWSSVDLGDEMEFQGGFVAGMKKVGPRIEGKNRQAVGGVIGVGSEEDSSSGRVRLKVS